MDQFKSLSFASRVYLLSSDAEAAFQIYFESLKNHFKRYKDSESKINDIEFEIADKLDEIFASKDHINKDDIDKIIQFFGYAEQWDQQFASEEPLKNNNETPFFLEPKTALIGGVCSGLSTYFSINVTLLRALTIVLSIMFFPLFIFYLILWWLAPTAQTHAIKENTRRFSKQSSYLKKAATILSAFLSKFLAIIFLVIAGLFIFAIVITVIYLIDQQQLDLLQIQIFTRNIQAFYIVSLFAAVLLPFLLIFMLGLRILRNRPYFKYTWTLTIALWFSSVVFLLYQSSLIQNEFDYESSYTVTQYLAKEASKTVILRTNFSEDDNLYTFLAPDINLITSAQSDSVRIQTRYTAVGASRKSARENANKIIYEAVLRNNKVLLENQFSFTEETPYRLQAVEIDIYVPLHSKVQISNFHPDFFYIEDRRHRYANRSEWRFNRGFKLENRLQRTFEESLKLKSTKNGFEIDSY
jgi:phage shock protein PspC (stress-responsive transcriptional regulator)